MYITPHSQTVEFQNFILLARALERVLSSESEASAIAVAWFVRNRLEDGKKLEDVIATFPHRRAVEEQLLANDGSNLLAAIGILARVFEGTLPDPTAKATKIHRHDECPAWALKAEPCALIGSYFYYADPQPSLNISV